VVGFWANFGPCVNGWQQQLRPILRAPAPGNDDCPTMYRSLACSEPNFGAPVSVMVNASDEPGLEPTAEPELYGTLDVLLSVVHAFSAF
jgi:hypothetical protein